MAAKPSRASSPERIRILLLQKALRAGVIVDGTRDGLLEAVHVRATFMGVDVVGEGHDGIRGIGAGPLQGHLHGAVGVLGLEVDGLVQGLLAVVQELHEVDDAAHGLENLSTGVPSASVMRSSVRMIFKPRFRKAISRKRAAKVS